MESLPILGGRAVRTTPFTDQSVIRMANMAYFEQQLAKTVGIGFLKPEPRITTLAPYG
jgi:hypothetical protein